MEPTIGLQLFITGTLLFMHAPVLFGENILVILPLTARSHFKSFQPLLEEMVRRGHNLTIVSGYQLGENFQSNYTHINVRNHFWAMSITFSEMRQQNRLQNLIFNLVQIHKYNDYLLQQPELQVLFESKDTYDLVMTELFFMDIFFTFGYRFDAPTIGLSAQNLISFYSWVLGNPFSSSQVPNMFLPLTESMSYIERISNFGFNLLSILYYELVAIPMYQTQMEKYMKFDDKPVPKLRNLMSNISAAFVNTHYSFGYFKPYLPNVIETAGIHITPTKPLPANIQSFMDDASNGVIYLSLGSLIEPQNMKKTGKIFIKILEKLPQKVLFKWEPQILPYIPKNFMVQEWMPQTDILKHPNCRLFITHGGLHSLLESLNNSVPFVGIPFFTDQHHNLAIAEYYKIGKTVNFNNVEEELLDAVQEILYDSRYQENIKRRSRLFNERLSNPIDTAIYWLEHIISHKKDVSHLKPVALRMPWYRYLELDIIMTCIVILLVVVFTSYYISSCILKGCKHFVNDKISWRSTYSRNKNLKSD